MPSRWDNIKSGTKHPCTSKLRLFSPKYAYLICFLGSQVFRLTRLHYPFPIHKNNPQLLHSSRRVAKREQDVEPLNFFTSDHDRPFNSTVAPPFNKPIFFIALSNNVMQSFLIYSNQFQRTFLLSRRFLYFFVGFF